MVKTSTSETRKNVKVTKNCKQAVKYVFWTEKQNYIKMQKTRIKAKNFKFVHLKSLKKMWI